MKNSARKPVLIIILVLLIVIALIVMISLNVQKDIPEESAVTETTETTTVTTTTEATTTTTIETTTEATTTTEPYVSPIDFEEQWNINPDIYAWITLENSVIDYPVLQNSEDYLYYLRRDIYGQSDTNGCIFSENFAAKDFSDPVTVIYGHKMRSGAMFGCFINYVDEEFLSQHRSVTIYTPDSEINYTVFGVVIYSDILISSVYDITDSEGAIDFMNSVYENNNEHDLFLDDVEVTPGVNRILVMSTCSTYSRSQRMLVLAVASE